LQHGRMAMKLHICLAAALLSLSATVCGAQEWAKKMFDQTTFDFGTVAKGAKVERVFNVENIYVEDAHIASVTSNCGCTTAKLANPSIKTWEKAQITATVDTRNYVGNRDATLRVVFDKPFPAEVQIQVHGFIRSDIVLRPEAVQFGSVAQGKSYKQTVNILYAGRSDWRILKVESANPNLQCAVNETSRNLSQVNYELSVTLKADAPAGYIQDHVYLVTNDASAQSARVPVAVEGVVTAPLTARPSPLMMGLVDAGQTATNKLVVQGQSAFRVTSIKCSDPRLKATAPEESKTWHVLPVTFTAEGEPGKVEGKIHIETDLGAAVSIDVPVQVQVVSKQPAATEPAKDAADGWRADPKKEADTKKEKEAEKGPTLKEDAKSRPDGKAPSESKPQPDGKAKDTEKKNTDKKSDSDKKNPEI
jgi:hypothetical protein